MSIYFNDSVLDDESNRLVDGDLCDLLRSKKKSVSYEYCDPESMVTSECSDPEHIIISAYHKKMMIIKDDIVSNYITKVKQKINICKEFKLMTEKRFESIIFTPCDDYYTDKIVESVFNIYCELFNFTVNYDQIITLHNIYNIYDNYISVPIIINKHIMGRELYCDEINSIIITYLNSSAIINKCIDDSIFPDDFDHIYNYLIENYETISPDHFNSALYVIYEMYLSGFNIYTLDEDKIIKIYENINKKITKISNLYFEFIIGHDNKSTIDIVLKLSMRINNIDIIKSYIQKYPNIDMINYSSHYPYNNNLFMELFNLGYLKLEPNLKLMNFVLHKYTRDDFPMTVLKMCYSNHPDVDKSITIGIVKMFIICTSRNIYLENDENINFLKFLWPEIFSTAYTELFDIYMCDTTNIIIKNEIKNNVINCSIDNYEAFKYLCNKILLVTQQYNFAIELLNVVYNNIYQSYEYVDTFQQVLSQLIFNFNEQCFNKSYSYPSSVLHLITDYAPEKMDRHTKNNYLSYAMNCLINLIEIDGTSINYNNRYVMDLCDFKFCWVLMLVSTNDIGIAHYIIDNYKFNEATIIHLIYDVYNKYSYQYYTNVYIKLCEKYSGRDTKTDAMIRNIKNIILSD